jgi:hypothetical protein
LGSAEAAGRSEEGGKKYCASRPSRESASPSAFSKVIASAMGAAMTPCPSYSQAPFPRSPPSEPRSGSNQ